jgi:hypothetical protein
MQTCIQKGLLLRKDDNRNISAELRSVELEIVSNLLTGQEVLKRKNVPGAYILFTFKSDSKLVIFFQFTHILQLTHAHLCFIEYKVSAGTKLQQSTSELVCGVVFPVRKTPRFSL